MCAIIKNPLQRDGTSQQQRLAKILLPENAKIDDRSIEEIITFACEYIKLINYYNQDNIIDDEGWSCFYKKDECILLALTASTDTDYKEAKFKSLEEAILKLTEQTNNEEDYKEEKLSAYYRKLINLIFSIAKQIQKICKRLPGKNLLKEEIIALIKSELHLSIIDNKQQDALIKLIGYDKAGIGDVNDYKLFIETEKNNTCECTKAWQLNQEGYDCIFPDTSFDLPSFKILFYIFFTVLLRIKKRAAFYFEACIKSNDTHQPHVTLFLTFLYLFRNATDHLNTLTRTHLLYYYEKILCLHKRAAIPDKVHVIFELAKNFDTHLVEEGTLLNAGKDDTSKQMVYALLEEVVVNKAKVEEIKTLYIEEVSGVVNAAPKANTKDGIAEDFKKEEQVHWKALGGIDSPDAEVGFALASPMFFLKEGLRTGMISYKLADDTDINSIPPNLSFRLLYSSEKEWIEIENIFDAINRILLPARYPNLYQLYIDNLPQIHDAINKGFDAIKELYDKLYPDQTASANGIIKTKSTTKAEDLDVSKLSNFIGKADVGVITASLLKMASTVKSGTKKGKKTSAARVAASIDEEALRKEILLIRNDILSLKQVYINRLDIERKEFDFFFVANTTAKAFTPYEADEKNPGISSDWPIIKTLIKNNYDDIGNKFSSQYVTVKDLKIKGVDIKVAAYGMRDLVVQNDTSILDNSKETQPFTNKPYKGSYYYIGSKEVFQKKLDIVGAQLEWANKPADFSSYYANYITKTITNNSFGVNAEVLNGGIYQDIFPDVTHNLFSQDFLGKTIIILGQIKSEDNNGTIGTTDNGTVIGLSEGSVIDDVKNNGFELRSFARDPYIPDFADYNVNVRRGFMRLTLTPQDFLHNEYPLAYTAVVAKEGKDLNPIHLPNEPYTPKLKNTSLFYISSERILFGPNQSNSTIEQFYHITPFGYQQMEIDKSFEVFLLPQFDYAAEVDGSIKFTQGNLYIGLKDARPEQKVNILFQVLYGSGDNRYSPPDVEWDYLVNNEWVPFKPFEIQDYTRADESSKKSLLRSGIVEFILPKNITNKETTILNPGLLWIKACAHEDPLPAGNNFLQVTQRIAALPDLVAIIAQAGIAQFEDHGNSLNHLAMPLPANIISKFMDSRAAIKSVSQPYNSFDGRLPENDYQFYRRISERLRHKNRAVCIWDYERLALEQFPDLYKVKCINHTNILENKEIAPGFVTIAVIPDLRNNNTANTAEPRVPVGMLDEIKVFLKKHTNLFTGSTFSPVIDYLQIVNPLYEQLQVTCCVRFYEGLDPAYYRYVLNNDLKNFLAPWAYNSNSEISFGFAYHKSAILNFIEERKYIDVVLAFDIAHYTNDLTTPLPKDDSDWIIPTTSRSILTTINTPGNDDIEHNIFIASYDENDPCKNCDDEFAKAKVLPVLKM